MYQLTFSKVGHIRTWVRCIGKACLKLNDKINITLELYRAYISTKTLISGCYNKLYWLFVSSNCFWHLTLSSLISAASLAASFRTELCGTVKERADIIRGWFWFCLLLTSRETINLIGWRGDTGGCVWLLSASDDAWW